MSSTDWNELLARYADGEVSADERRAVEDEIARSPALGRIVDRWRALRDCAGRAMAADCAPAGLQQRLCATLRGDTGYAGTRTYKFVTYFAAAAAVILLALFWNRESSIPNVAQAGFQISPERFAETYESCAKKIHEGVKLEGHCPVAAQALLDQTCRDYVVAVPDLRPQGYELLGICHCLRHTNVKVTHAYYRSQSDPSRIISVFSIDRCMKLGGCKTECCDTKRQYELAQVKGVSIVHWEEHGGHFAMAGELDSATLANLASGVRVVSR